MARKPRQTSNPTVSVPSEPIAPAPGAYQEPPSTPQTNPNDAAQALAGSSVNFGAHDPGLRPEAGDDVMRALQQDVGDAPRPVNDFEPMSPEDVLKEAEAAIKDVIEPTPVLSEALAEVKSPQEHEVMPDVPKLPESGADTAEMLVKRAQDLEDSWQEERLDRDTADMQDRFTASINEIVNTVLDGHRRKILEINKKRLKYNENWELVIDLLRHCIDSNRWPVRAEQTRTRENQRMMAVEGKQDCVVCGIPIKDPQVGQRTGCSAAGVMYQNGATLTAPLVNLCPVMREKKQKDPAWYNPAMGLMVWPNANEQKED